MRKMIAAALLLPAVLLLSSCELMPEEAAPKTVPVVRNADTVTYKTEQVYRGSLMKKSIVYCTYMPLRTETLYFPVGGEYVDEVFVQVGDTVEEGQLLAQLNMDDVEERIDACKRTIRDIEMELGYLSAYEEIEIRRQTILHGHDEEACGEAIADVRETYARRRVMLEDSLYIARLELAELEEDKAQRQIRAPFGGVITYTRSFEAGDLSNPDDRVVTVVDSSMSIFRAETEHWAYMPAGTVFTVMVDGVAYEAVVTTPEELGLEPEEYREGVKGKVYLRPVGLALDLSDNDRGKFDIVFESREDVLIVPAAAVATMGDTRIVYYVQENGLKNWKPVTTGLEADGKVEIIDGLTEGEYVIVSY